MGFKFRYDSVLKQRGIEKNIAHREFVEAEAKVRQQINKINGMYDQIDKARISALGNLEGQVLSVATLGQTEEFIKLQLTKIDGERNKARELLATMEENQEVLAEKAKEFKTVETLKEKDLQKFKTELQRKEQKEIDDLNIIRASRR